MKKCSFSASKSRPKTEKNSTLSINFKLELFYNFQRFGDTALFSTEAWREEQKTLLNTIEDQLQNSSETREGFGNQREGVASQKENSVRLLGPL